MITKKLEDGSLEELSDAEYREMFNKIMDELEQKYVQDEEYEMAAACKDRKIDAKTQSIESIKEATTKLKILMIIENL